MKMTLPAEIGGILVDAREQVGLNALARPRGLGARQLPCKRPGSSLARRLKLSPIDRAGNRISLRKVDGTYASAGT
jgi:hypothetical protein